MAALEKTLGRIGGEKNAVVDREEAGAHNFEPDRHEELCFVDEDLVKNRTINALQNAIYPVLKVYRLKIEATFAAGSAILVTLPALTDEGSGTPQPGTLTGNLQAATNEAVLAGTASPSTTVVKHQLRAELGLVPDVTDETVQATFNVGDPIALTTSYGLGVPGATVNFRLAAITADGHENGTPWVQVQRPIQRPRAP